MIKRFFDILAAAAALVVLSPIIAIVALLIRRKLGSPVLFRQTRPGLHGKPFEMVKFRTQLAAPAKPGKPCPLTPPDAAAAPTTGQPLSTAYN